MYFLKIQLVFHNTFFFNSFSFFSPQHIMKCFVCVFVLTVALTLWCIYSIPYTTEVSSDVSASLKMTDEMVVDENRIPELNYPGENMTFYGRLFFFSSPFLWPPLFFSLLFFNFFCCIHFVQWMKTWSGTKAGASFSKQKSFEPFSSR